MVQGGRRVSLESLGATWVKDEGQRSEDAFEIVGEISAIETIAVGRAIRDYPRLGRTYGKGRWRKRTGHALVRVEGVTEVFTAELHWYEATGIGRRELKVKRRLD
jgi:hypothetical protein